MSAQLAEAGGMEPPLEAGDPPPELRSRVVARVAVTVFAFNTFGLLLGACVAASGGLGGAQLAALAAMYVLTIAGVGVGFHQLLAHRSFKTGKWTERALAVLGSMAGQGSPLYWVSHHRRHHRFSDRPGDPHSPHAFAGQRFGRLRGIWHGHIGWALGGAVTDPTVYARDLLRDPGLRRISQLYLLWVGAGLLLPGIVLLAVEGELQALWSGMLWGGVVRMALVQHAVALTGSLGHLVGRRPYASHDRSTDNGWLAVVTFGGSMHNAHHAFPSAAITAHAASRRAPNEWLILALEALGLAWDVKRADPSRRLEAARQRAGARPAAAEGGLHD